MEYFSKNTIFGLKMMVKSGLEKIFLKFLHAGDYFPLLHKSAQNHKFSIKNNYPLAWRDFKTIFSRPLFTIIFWPKMVFLDTDSILRVKPMYESVKQDVLISNQEELISIFVTSSSKLHEFYDHKSANMPCREFFSDQIP